MGIPCKNVNITCVLSHFSHILVILWTIAPRLLCPWDSPGNNTGVDCHCLLQGIFLTKRSNPGLLCLLHKWFFLPLAPSGKH